jgi:hypothetical protein
LIGFRNRLVVATNWAWNYLTFQRGARLITGISGSRIEDVTPPVPVAAVTDDGPYADDRPSPAAPVRRDREGPPADEPALAPADQRD